MIMFLFKYEVEKSASSFKPVFLFVGEFSFILTNLTIKL